MLLAEDVTVEALVALVNHFLERNLPVIVRAASRELFDFSGDHSSDFKRFYESTFALLFESDISAARLYQSHLETGMNTEVNSMFFITHLLDPEILLLLEEQRANNFQLTLIYNQTAEAAGGVPGAGSRWPAAGADRQTLAYSGYFNRLREQGTRVVTLRGAESIVADLEATMTIKRDWLDRPEWAMRLKPLLVVLYGVGISLLFWAYTRSSLASTCCYRSA